MPYGLYLSAAGAQAQRLQMDTLANNLANVDTPGFKADLALVQARHAEAIEQGLDHAGSRTINDVGGGVFAHETKTNFAPGPLKLTGNPADVALAGDGFFVVEKDGQQLLTRAGNFQVTSTGRLVTTAGHDVLDETSRPIVIPPGGFEISEAGVVSQGNTPIATLAVVKPNQIGDLTKAGENLFAPLAEVAPVPPAERMVRSGYVEQSNVRPALAMMQMVETQRAFESNMKLIQNQDHMLGTLISRVLAR